MRGMGYDAVWRRLLLLLLLLLLLCLLRLQGRAGEVHGGWGGERAVISHEVLVVWVE